MLVRDRESAAELLTYHEVVAAYRKGTGTDPPKSTLVRWAYQSVSEQERNSHWYQQALKDKDELALRAELEAGRRLSRGQAMFGGSSHTS
jgi:hypothetical protein